MTLQEFVVRENLQISSVFTGKVEDNRKKNIWGHFAWKVELLNLQGRPTLTTPELYSDSFPRYSLIYKKGLGHQGFYNSLTKQWRYATDKEIKDFSLNKNDWWNAKRQPKPIPPSLIEVVSSLHIECVSIVNTPLWEDWASEFGLNVDSIKDKKNFDAVTAQYLELRKFFGNKFQEFLGCENDY